MKRRKTEVRPLMVNPGESPAGKLPTQVVLLGESDYEEHMSGANPRWRKEHVRQGDFRTPDGLSLRYYFVRQEDLQETRACIVMIHGYCGFWCKFHEMAEYYWRAGYDVFFLEQRGHGYSDRQVREDDLVHVDDYGDYVRDLHIFMDQIVKPKTRGLKHILFAHSMGGAIGTLYLEEYSGDFAAAILSSPMLAVRTNGLPRFVIPLLRAKIKILRQEKKPLRGAKPWTGEPAFASSSAMSLKRYTYIFQKRLEDSHYHTNRMSGGWAAASFRATKKALKYAGEIRIPILLFSAGNDALVDIAGHYELAEKTEDTRWIFYEGAKHELFNANDAIRRDYYVRIFSFLEHIASEAGDSRTSYQR